MYLFSFILYIRYFCFICFRPLRDEPLVLENATIIKQFSGKLVEEVHQKWKNEYADVYQSIRWYKNENYLEFDWIVGNIDL